MPRSRQDDVTPFLSFRLPPQTLEGTNHVVRPQQRDRRHETATSISFVTAVRGMPFSAPTARQARIASAKLDSASASHPLCLPQPGMAPHSGHSPTLFLHVHSPPQFHDLILHLP